MKKIEVSLMGYRKIVIRTAEQRSMGKPSNFIQTSTKSKQQILEASENNVEILKCTLIVHWPGSVAFG